MRFAWSITVLFVNTILIAVILVAENFSSRMHAVNEYLSSPALVATITIAAVLAQGITAVARMLTRWVTRTQ